MDNKVSPVLRVVADEIEFQIASKLDLNGSTSLPTPKSPMKTVSSKSAIDLAFRKALFEICRMFKERDLVLKVYSFLK